MISESVEMLVGAKINEYIITHRLSTKLNGIEEWTEDERAMPKIASRITEPTLPRLMNSSIYYNNGISSSSVSSVESCYLPSWETQKK